MSSISVWIISVTVATLIASLVDIVLSQGKMSKMIKSVMGVFILIIIISPIKSIDLSKLDLSKIGSFGIDYHFIEERSGEVISSIENEIKTNLEENGYKSISIKINGEYKSGKVVIDSIYVDLSHLVINDKSVNIDKYTNIVAIIKKMVDVEEEKIIFYE